VRLKGAPERALTYSQLIREARLGNVVGEGAFVTQARLDLATGQGVASAQWHSAVAACEVEVDTETGRVEVTRFHAGVYVGRKINPLHCELQVEGSVLFGLGQALFEEVCFETDGRIANANLADYMLPSFEDVPAELTLNILETEHAREVHGIGETCLPPVRPAIGNAVSRALGVRINELPLTPERVLRALQMREEVQASTSERAPELV
jgi:CO/xanthine dehydrogenase Mo-binding subunit